MPYRNHRLIQPRCSRPAVEHSEPIPQVIPPRYDDYRQAPSSPVFQPPPYEAPPPSYGSLYPVAGNQTSLTGATEILLIVRLINSLSPQLTDHSQQTALNDIATCLQRLRATGHCVYQGDYFKSLQSNANYFQNIENCKFIMAKIISIVCTHKYYVPFFSGVADSERKLINLLKNPEHSIVRSVIKSEPGANHEDIRHEDLAKLLANYRN